METNGTNGTDERPIQVLGIAGSLRRGSYNRKLLEAARTLAPQGMRIELFDIAEIPPYNADLDTDAARPAAVARLKRAITAADAILIATPEYNHSVPGVLQNAIDWASRPNGKSPFVGKPAAIMGASTGALGSARGQQQLKLVLLSTLASVMAHPGVAVGMAAEKFDASGALTHEPTRQFVASFLRSLAEWTHRLMPRLAPGEPAQPAVLAA
ncbi:MAG: NAD(P)H-dependent oxidoreductase [Gemmatimonadaceae bacterium]